MIKEKNFTKIELGENTGLILCNSDATIFDSCESCSESLNGDTLVMSVIDSQGNVRSSIEYWNAFANFANTMSLAI